MYPDTEDAVGLSLSSRTELSYVVGALSGELDIASAPVLREQLLGLLGPSASRLVIDLSGVSYADASGLAVMVGTGRRAQLLGGFLRLAAPEPAVAEVLRVTGLDRHLDVFPTVQAAIASQDRDRPGAWAAAGAASRVHTTSSRAALQLDWHAVSVAELRLAVGAVLGHADAWRDADPDRQFSRALRALARAYAGASQTALVQAAHSLLGILTRQPLTHSPAVADTASKLRRVLGGALVTAVPTESA